MTEFKEKTLLNSATSTGAGEAEVMGYESATVAISGTFVAEIKIQGKLGDEWYDLAVVNCSTLDYSESITAAGLYAVVGADKCQAIRANVTSYTSGEINAIGRFSF